MAKYSEGFFQGRAQFFHMKCIFNTSIEAVKIGKDIVDKLADKLRILSLIENPKQKYQLLYRGSENDFRSDLFHQNCDKNQPTTIIYLKAAIQRFGTLLW